MQMQILKFLVTSRTVYYLPVTKFSDIFWKMKVFVELKRQKNLLFKNSIYYSKTVEIYLNYKKDLYLSFTYLNML